MFSGMTRVSHRPEVFLNVQGITRRARCTSIIKRGVQQQARGFATPMSSRVCTRCLAGNGVRARQLSQVEAVTKRFLHHQTPVQVSAYKQANLSPSTPRPRSKPQEPDPKARKATYIRSATFTLLGAALLTTGYLAYSSGIEDESLNTTKFTDFNIISKEQISHTAFVLTIRCRDTTNAKNLAKYKAAWEHGLWSVEIKQPQLQIARNYTPLPPLNSADGETGELRFLIRRMDGGEMSNYLSKLKVGDKVWLRGPHYGFDISKRLGKAGEVVFLAGGTGIAPALQIAHKLLDGARTGDKPSIHILWANRKSVDSVAREELAGKVAKTVKDSNSLGYLSRSSLHDQILDSKNRHGDNLSLSYFVDDEKTFIGLKDIDAAMGGSISSRKISKLAPVDQNCRWHSPAILSASTDEEDALQGTARDCACPSRSPTSRGRNILCVSGPDGFIQAYVGPKRWFEGREIQGSVQGLVSSMKTMSKGGMDDWLVLKL
ncbi:uncharacterized protein BCR38DRAFT_417839 [Pseudomassariella vexata]|uniref:FAD-binding FR-type domain-containing protein n=1 Tax=Pseudomassariella vexata TaxID=1141098 RepID=A0A1Y2EJP8_9PEZI|nr:uncharacterized protein BCR38DRAFT_417839 [Pseudomassariella vexata]ORY71727.1 hypothetical protein BCR38DRAFT_417839 [Pseudomassariella vexata]